MLSLDDKKVVKTGSSSKGNQLKFYDNDYWIKLDNQYEGLAEDFISKFEQCIIGFNSVDYYTSQFIYNDEIRLGCYSYNMYEDVSVNFISLRNLFRKNNVPLNIFIKEDLVESNIKMLLIKLVVL